MNNLKKKIVYIDSNALIHRAYHAFPKNLTTIDGELVNAVYGFCSLTLQIIKKLNPDYLIFAFDSKGPTFRHEIFKEYKATRKPMDEELRTQFSRIKEVVRSIEMPLIEKSGYEADDIIGTLTRSSNFSGFEKVVVTGDKDLMQLIDADTKIFLSGSSFAKSTLYDQDNAVEKIGVDPSLLTDYKGLRGDPSDNIPGVKGIGDKSAISLINDFGDLESIYKSIENVNSRYKNKLESEKERAFLSKDLATINTSVPIDVEIEESDITNFNFLNLRKIFIELQFKSLISRIPKSIDDATHQKNNVGQKNPEQASLFSNLTNNRNTPNEKLEVSSVQLLTSSDVVKLESAEDMIIVPDEESCTFVLRDSGSFYINGDVNSKLRDGLTEVLTGKGLIGYDTKRVKHLLKSFGVAVGSFKFDLMLASHVTSGGSRKNDLSNLVFDLTGELWEELVDKSKKSEVLWTIYELLKSEIEADEIISRLFYEIELPLVDVLFNVENNGIALDSEYLRNLENELEQMLVDIEKEIFEECGTEFNIASPKQLGIVLFEGMGIPGGRKTKSGGYSTNEKVLKPLVVEYPVVEKILSYREIAKMKSTYTKALLDAVNDEDGRIHTTYHQLGAATGRFSSSDPNLQNIPIASDLGQRVRRAFVAPEGKLFLMIDYSQQELRLLASLSGEPKLIEAFEKGIDIHALTSAQLFGKQVSEITKQERRIGKTVNFGVVYGISAYGLSEGLGIERAEAQSFIDLFYQSYPKVKSFFDNYLKEAKEKGFAQTIYGRKRDAVGLRSKNFQLRRAVEREIINFPIQGGAADMMKESMIDVSVLLEERYNSFAKMILQIHDELVFEVNASDPQDKLLKEFVKDVSKVMTKEKSLSVSMIVDVEYGINLADKKKI